MILDSIEPGCDHVAPSYMGLDIRTTPSAMPGPQGSPPQLITGKQVSFHFKSCIRGIRQVLPGRHKYHSHII